jgi:hypothetical protein
MVKTTVVKTRCRSKVQLLTMSLIGTISTTAHAYAIKRPPAWKASPVLSRCTCTEGDRENQHYGENYCDDDTPQPARIGLLA